MKCQVLFCSFLLWPSLVLAVSPYADSLHKWKGSRENAFKKDETEEPLVITDDNGAQSFPGIQADALGENTQVTLNTNAEKEAVMHELDDDGGPVFNHDANIPSKAKETESNDMSHYDTEEINLVANSRHKKVDPKPVRLPSLTEEGKVDTVVVKANSTDDNDSLKVVKSDKGQDNSSTKSTESLTSDEKVKTDSTPPKATTSKPKNSEHRSLKPLKTKHRSFTSEIGSSNIFNMPEVKHPEDDELLPKSSKMLLGESDDSSSEKLRKSGERLTMFYDRDLKKKQSVARKVATKPGQTQKAAPRVNVRGGQIVGGQISGGNIFGGDIEGGFIKGGTIRGGVVRGGRMSDGLMDGGLLLDGTIAGGFLHNGTVKGGMVRGGNITGGVVSGGTILGGHVSSGFVAGGVLRKGGVEGGVLRGGLIDGGTLKGGVMESGKLLGGIVWNGRVTGGTILGGEVLGGEVGEGVVIRGGRINGTVTVGRKMVSGFNKPVRPQGLPKPSRLANLQNQARLQDQLFPQNRPSLNDQIFPQNQFSPNNQPSPNRLPNQQYQPRPQYRPNLYRALSLHHPVRPYSSLSNQDAIEGIVGSRINRRPSVSQSIPSGDSNGASSANIENDAIVINHKKKPNVIVLSNISRAREEIKRNYQPNGFYNRQAPASYANPNYPSPNNPYPSYGYQATGTSPQYPATNSFPSPPAASVQNPQQNGISINQFVRQMANGASGAQRSSTGENNKGDAKPKYHWILNQIRNGEVSGVPAGRKFIAKGGVRLNRASIGFDGTATFMDGGTYAGTCVSDPNLCSRGLSVEMTIKVDPAATMYRAPRYILDSGASSFNSRGVALYTMDNKLRADVAIQDKAYCLVVPLVTDKWQDVVLSYRKNGELSMYINCKLMARTESDEHCINCHTPGCHTADTNTKLVLGKANGDEPQSNFARFKASDLSIYERFLTPQDIDKICGLSKPENPSPPSGSYMPAGPVWNSPVVNSFPRIQPGFLKSAISGPQKATQNAINVSYTQKKTQAALNSPYFSPWGSWTMCSTTCGLGTKTRQRSCIYTHAQSGWQTCHGVTFQAKKCTSKCPGTRQHAEKGKTAPKANNHDTAGKKAHSKIVKSVTKTKSKSTVLKRKKVISEKQKKEKTKNKKDVTGLRRNKITRILSKLGNLLGNLSK